MLKKVGISLLLAITLLLSSFNFANSNTAFARQTCGNSVAECRERQRDVRANIESLLGEAAEVQDEISILQNDIAILRAEILEIEEAIAELETRLYELEVSIRELEEKIEENLQLLYETNNRIDVLLDEVAQRLRVTQTINNRNMMLVLLSESESFVDLIRNTRAFTRIAALDAQAMEELNELLDFQEALKIELDEQMEFLNEQMTYFSEILNEREIEQAGLEAAQYKLIAEEAALREIMYAINQERHNEEELLRQLEEAERVLRDNPPPKVAAPQTPNATGLAHPMPGSHVTSEFGPRWGGWHAGIDLVVRGNPNAAVLAAASGTIITNTWENGFGWYIIISHNIDGQRVDTLYAHLHVQSPLPVGTVVTQGEIVGTKGNSGQSFGAHLHFEVHPGGISWGRNRGDNPRNWINF